MHEFLVLHYLATDSAREWDVFLDSCLPLCTWVRAGSRRALALHMYDKCHIAPSHRRFAHPSWIAGMKLMLDLLLGARKHRYLGRCLADPRPAEVYVRGFSAGSFSGICLLHLLWNMPHVQVGGILGGISCPPALLHGILPEHGDRLMLIHLTTDRLCQWHPYDKTLNSLNCKYCIVDRSTLELRELFGTCEHSYGHWIDLSLPHGRYPFYQLLRQYQDVAPPQARDIAPLRLVSWVSCEVPDHVQHVLHQLMALFGEVAPVSSDKVIAIGVQQLGVTARGEISWDMVRDTLIREVTFGGTTCPYRYNPLVSQEGDGLLHLTVSLSAMRGVSGMWSIPSMRPSSFGQGRVLCTLQLPGITNHSCFWPLPCFPTVPPSRLKVRRDPHMTSNVFKWACARAILSSSVSGVELATSKVY